MEKSQSEQDLDLLSKDPIIPSTPIDLEEQDEMIKEANKGIIPEIVEEKIANDSDELEFKVALDSNERGHFKIIVKSQKVAIASLREQLQKALAEIEDLKSKLTATEEAKD